MSRYYDIVITTPGSAKAIKEYTSFPGKQNDPGALNVVLDIYENALAVPQGLGVVQVWGVSLQDIAQASNLTGNNISVYAGFQKGLPLNQPAQAGLILVGTVWQSYANWAGVEMTLDLIVAQNGELAEQESNVSFLWLAGTPLATALATTLSSAFPGVAQSIQVDPSLILNHDVAGYYSSLTAFAQMLKAKTAAAIGGDYAGVDIVLTPDAITVFDGSTQATPKRLAFTDLIGQPTWIGPQTIQFLCPMRSDYHMGDYVKMPQGLLGVPGAVVTTQASLPQFRQQSAFTGVFMINLVHHLGNFRQPDGQSWVTVFNAIVAAQAASTTSATTSATEPAYNTPQYGPS